MFNDVILSFMFNVVILSFMFNDVILSFMINFNFKDLLSNIGHRPNIRYGIETETKTGNEWTLP